MSVIGARRLMLVLPALLVATAAGADTATVVVTGIDAPLRTNVEARLALAALSDRTDLTEAAIRRLHRRAPQQIRGALQPFGYYEPVIETRLRNEGAQWTATYTVSAGPVVKLDAITVEINGPGKAHPAVTDALLANQLQRGEPLHHGRYEALKKALLRAARDQGYLDAGFTQHELRVDVGNRIAEATLVLDTGSQFLFGEVTIEQDAVSDGLAQRYAAIEPGTPYDASKLLDAQYALRDSGYYGAVNVRAERERAIGNRVPVVISATARKRQRYSAGIGYATDVGPRVTLGWVNRRINSRGHRASFDTRVSQPRIDVTARYVVPFSDPRSDRYTYTLAHHSEDLGADTTSERLETGLAQTLVLGEWQRNTYLNLTREITVVGTTRSSDVLLLPGMTFTRSRTDDVIQPRHASRISADLRGSHNVLGAATDFVRLKLENRLIRPLGKGRLLLRSDLGVVKVDNFENLPGSQRFFTGGDRSVRGFELNEISPLDSGGLSEGGTYLTTGSVELEWPIAGRWSAALFVDAGTASNTLFDGIEASVGIGGRLRTPIGMIRLDLAKPVTVGKALRFHLVLGSDL